MHRVWPPVVVDGLHRSVKRLGDAHAAEDAVAEPVGCDRVEATARVPRCGDRVDEVLHRAFDAAEPTCRTSPGSTFRRCASSSKASMLRPVSRSMPSSRPASCAGRSRTRRTHRSPSIAFTRAGGCTRMDRCACCGTAISRGRRPVAAPSVSTRTSRARPRFRARFGPRTTPMPGGPRRVNCEASWSQHSPTAQMRTASVSTAATATTGRSGSRPMRSSRKHFSAAPCSHRVNDERCTTSASMHAIPWRASTRGRNGREPRQRRASSRRTAWAGALGTSTSTR